VPDEDDKSVLSYADSQTGSAPARPEPSRPFKLDMDHRRNLRSLIVLMCIGVGLLAALLFFVFVIVH
jgi:hypothetical protein